VQVVEVMGRDAGWIAVTAGIAGGADVILTPEHEIDMDDVVRASARALGMRQAFRHRGRRRGRQDSQIEGQVTVGDKLDSFGHARLSGIGQVLAEEIEKRTGYETRSVKPGHTQRGGNSTAYDRMLATRYGIAAIDMVHEGKFGAWRCSREPRSRHLNRRRKSPRRAPWARISSPSSAASSPRSNAVAGCWLLVDRRWLIVAG